MRKTPLSAVFRRRKLPPKVRQSHRTAKGFITADGRQVEIGRLPEELIKDRAVTRVASNISLSADGKYILLDSAIGNSWTVSLMELKTGKVEKLHWFSRHYGHAQFSPTDPELFLIDQDWWRDSISGEYFPFDNRIWLMDTKGTRFEPLLPDAWVQHNSYICHDFWSQQGKLCWIDYNTGAFECDLASREVVHVWKTPLCHAHCNADGSLWCADQTPYRWDTEPCQVKFFNRQTGMEVNIFSALPKPPVDRRKYHLDPHPSFSPNGRWITSFTTVRGQGDVAVTETEPLKKETERGNAR